MLCKLHAYILPILMMLDFIKSNYSFDFPVCAYAFKMFPVHIRYGIGHGKCGSCLHEAPQYNA